jgi:thimet oligopeptidase
VLEPLNDLWLTVDRGLNTASLYRNVHPDSDLRNVADVCEQSFQKLITDIGLSRPLYDAVHAVDVAGEDEVTQRYVRHVLRDFRRAGVDKDEATRANVRRLREELVKIGQQFNKNIREDVRRIALDSVDELEGLPEDYISAHQLNADGKIVITTDYPDYIPFSTYARSDARRLELYKEFRRRGHPANEQILASLLQRRYELARLLGYDNWAEYITEDKMIKTATAARSFIEKVADVSKERSKRDYGELLAHLRTEQPDAERVGDWQKSYIEEQLLREKYSFDSQALRQYFPYDGVRDGVLGLTAELFDVEYVRVDVPVWHEDVEAYELRDGGEVIGTFYLDMHPRDGKYKHAAAFPIRTGVAGKQKPEAALICNFPGGDSSRGLMEHDQVETFFHEFGHLLHHLFGGNHRWLGVSGFNTEWDFVEAPSQMLEEWAWNGAALNTFARNAEGEAIPEDLIAEMNRARDFGKGIQVRHQMFYAAVSLGYYDRDPTGIDTTAVLRELQARYSPFDYVDGTYFQLSFGHLDGYSAIYYTYMWSLVIAKDLLSVFEKNGLMNPDVAARYREHILEPGGSKDADAMVRDFLGRDYTFDAFAEWLNRS